MKFLRSCFLGALLCTAPAALKASVAGNYQALLYSEPGDLGSPVALVTTTVNTKGTLSGKLTTEDKKVYSFKTKTPLVFEEGNEATTEDIIINRGKGIAPLTLRMTFFDSEEGAYFFSDLLMDNESIGGTENGLPIFVFGKGPAAFAGSYTLALERATEPGEDEPAGSGYAIGKADAKGMLKLVGKTGDGTSFTAALPASEQQQFFMFINPYKRDGSFLAGKLKLGLREDELFNMLPAETGYDLQWKKSAGAKDKSYRDGFGPLDVLASIEPWTAPGKGETLGGILNIDLDESFDIAFSGGLPSSRTPTALALDIKNNLQVVTGAAGSPSTLIGTGWSKIFSGKIDPKTGKVTITINLEDSVPTSNPLRPKLVKRKVTIEGVVLKVEVEGEGEFRFAPGFMLIPPLDPKTGTISSYALEFQGPAVLNALFTSAGELAGTYTALMKLESVTPSGSPATPFVDGQNSTFTISADLKTITIGGRKLPLAGDSRPTSVVYTDAPKKYTNYYTVQIFLNFEGKPTGMFITHNQNIFGLPPVVKNVVFSSATIIKQ